MAVPIYRLGCLDDSEQCYLVPDIINVMTGLIIDWLPHQGFTVAATTFLPLLCIYMYDLALARCSSSMLATRLFPRQCQNERDYRPARVHPAGWTHSGGFRYRRAWGEFEHYLYTVLVRELTN